MVLSKLEQDRIETEALVEAERLRVESERTRVGPPGPQGPVGPAGPATANAIVRYSSEPQTSMTNVLAPDPGLTFAVAAGDIWTIYAVLWPVVGLGGIKLNLQMPIGSYLQGGATFTHGSGTSYDGFVPGGSMTVSFENVDKKTPTSGIIRLDAILNISAPGAVSIRSAQAVPNATSPTIINNGFLRAIKVA